MLISIFIPTYNANATLLDATLSSVVSQTHKDLEIWCVDDASTDDTPKRLDMWATKDVRIHVIHKPHEGDVPHSWNNVFEKLNGDFTLYLSHDDILSNDCIEKLARKQQESDYDCVIPTCVGFEKDNENPEKEFDEFNKRSSVKGRRTITGTNAFYLMLDYSIPGFALWRTDIIKRIGMPSESFNSDECMQRIWVSHCRQVAFEDNAVFNYRMASNSITKGLKPYHYGALLTLKRLCERAAEISNSENISEDNHARYNAFKKYVIKNQIYLSAQFWKRRKEYSPSEQDCIQNILDCTNKSTFPHIPHFLINIISWIYSKRI